MQRSTDMPASPRRILRRKEAAAYLGLAPSSLANMAVRGEGPPILRLSARAVGYEIAQLDLWLEGRRNRPAG